MGTYPWLDRYDPGVPATLEPYPDRTLCDYLTETAARHGDRTALLFNGGKVSYAQLEHLSDAFAASLVELGVRPGERVALCLPNCPQFIIAEFGAWKAGAIAAPFNPGYGDREMEDALNATGAETVVVLNRFYDRLKAIQPRTSVRRLIATNIKEYLPTTLRLAYTLLKEKDEGERITVQVGDVTLADLLDRHRDGSRPTVRVRATDPAIVLMSGGTTGAPKGVVGTHGGMVAAGLQLRAWLKSAMDEWTDVMMLPLPLFHVFANAGVQSLALLNHNPIALIANPRELRDVLKEIESVRPAFLVAVPTLLNGLLHHPLTRKGKADFSSIKLCFCGAAPLMAETKRRFEEMTGGVIVEGYSLTEAQMAVLANPVRGEKKVGSVGMPLPDVEVRIVDADDGRKPMPQGEVGEIVLRAPQLMQGYWNRPEDTAEMLRTNADGERLLYTGDLGYLDADGYVFIVDRKKDLIKTSGYQVWPREIEEIISMHPAVAEAAVAGIPDAMKGEVAKAWIVPRPGATIAPGEMKAWCRERLAPYKVPGDYEIVADLPKTQIGKVLRRALRQREMERQPVETPVSS
jgi:long-chain acyl-CoA synthetase